ncbi:hypothetical protein BGZ67_008253 [Mortierella alpina]|nr:hypothetical protein BGZ67_008253 [Mortierella alpina]
MSSVAPTSIVLEKPVSHQKVAVTQSECPVPHPFELESPGAEPSESILEARARRAAEQVRHREAVRAAQLEKCRKKEAVKHCSSSSWAAEINCGVCLETTVDDDELCLSDPCGENNSTAARTTAEVSPIDSPINVAVEEAVDEASESVINLDTDAETDAIDYSYDGDDSDSIDDIYTKLLDSDIDFDTLDPDLDLDGNKAGAFKNQVIALGTQEENDGGQEEQQEQQEQQEQNEQQEKLGDQKAQNDVDEHKDEKGHDDEEEQFWILGNRTVDHKLRRAVRDEIFAEEKVNIHGLAFVDSSALKDRNTIIQTFDQVREVMKLLFNVQYYVYFALE